MYSRPWHRTVQRVLEALNAPLLGKSRCFFGGGTRLVMELDEYRESLDVDLLCGDMDGYRMLRSEITEQSLGGILAVPLPLAREVRADRYGIRTFFDIDGSKVKFEIVAEGRIPLQGLELPPIPIQCLDHTSCFAEKLLANADRWGDRSTLSRDMIDLAFMRAAWGAIPAEARQRAEHAYGDVIGRNMDAALNLLLTDESYLRHCVNGLGVSDHQLLRTGLRLLREESIGKS